MAVVLSKAGVGQLVLYDNFHSNHIDPSKWVGEPSSVPGGSDKDRREVAVGLVGEEENRRLRISERAYSAITDNNGASGSGFGLGFANPSHLKAVSFTLAVNEAEAVGCAGNPGNPTFAGAGFSGDYFNPNPTSPQNGATGDITVFIGIGHLSNEVGTALDVSASISQCQDAQCNGQTPLAFQFLNFVQPDSTNTLSAIWDQPNHQFVFSLNNEPPVALTYNVPDSFPPGFPDKTFFVFGSVPHCTTTPRPLASIDAFFGNVYVNP
jgi:hypothetical protein